MSLELCLDKSIEAQEADRSEPVDHDAVCFAVQVTYNSKADAGRIG